LESFSTSGEILPGESFSLTFTIRNTSKAKTVSNLRFGFANDSFLPSSGLNQFTHERLAPGEAMTRTISMTAADRLSAGMTPFMLSISYSGGAENLSAYLKVAEVPPEEGNKISTPRVMIDSYTLDPANVEAGARFSFSFAVKNTSRTTAIENIKITVYSTDGVFTPVSGGNTFYTEEIRPGDTEDYVITLLAKAAAEQKSYPISIQIEYEYGANGVMSTTEQINVYVVQPIRLEFSNVYYPSDIAMGSSIYLSFTYYNKGKSPLTNLSITAEGDFMLDEGELFLGNFPAGSGDWFEAALYPMGMGLLSGSLVFTFEDAAGDIQRREIQLTVNVSDYGDVWKPIDPGWPPVDPGWPPEEAGGGLAWYWIAAICAGGAAVVLVTTLVIVKSAKKKKLAKEDEWGE